MLDLAKLRDRLRKEYLKVEFGYDTVPVGPDNKPVSVDVYPFNADDAIFIANTDGIICLINAESETFKTEAKSMYKGPIKTVDSAARKLKKAIEEYKKGQRELFEDLRQEDQSTNDIIFPRKWREEMGGK